MTDEIQYVEHSRYGNTPNFTGLNPDPMDPEVELHWYSTSLKEIETRYAAEYEALTGEKLPHDDPTRTWLTPYRRRKDEFFKRIENTAIVADPSKYKGEPIFAEFTHYFDIQRQCIGCRKLFLFYAEEQKYWYEVLQFALEATAKHCVVCRKRSQQAAWSAKRYKTLSHVKPRSFAEDLEMAECALKLVERRLGATKLLNRARMLLNRVQNKATETGLLTQASQLSDRLETLTGQ
ncbi:MAG: zinc-ribbon domain containing protein [Planctomycetaceae bacterium]